MREKQIDAVYPLQLTIVDFYIYVLVRELLHCWNSRYLATTDLLVTTHPRDGAINPLIVDNTTNT